MLWHTVDMPLNIFLSRLRKQLGSGPKNALESVVGRKPPRPVPRPRGRAAGDGHLPFSNAICIRGGSANLPKTGCSRRARPLWRQHVPLRIIPTTTSFAVPSHKTLTLDGTSSHHRNEARAEDQNACDMNCPSLPESKKLIE